jgi:hypothetical protein
MTTPRDEGPIAPRRPLGKPPVSPEESAEAATSSVVPVQTVTADGPPTSTMPAVEAPAQTAGERPNPQTDNGYVVHDRRSAVSEASESAPPVPGPAGPSAAAPVAPPLYHPDPIRPTGAPTQPRPWAAQSAVETQQTLPVPPGPVVVPPPPVDKRAERAAARAQRKLEASKPRQIRRAKLRVIRVDPWSVTKAAFLFSIAFGIMCVVAVFLIFSIMSASGLWDSVNTTIQGVVNQKPTEAFDIRDYVGMSRVMGITMLISAIDVVIITALATLGAFIYNMAASLLGGVEITLAEDLH